MQKWEYMGLHWSYENKPDTLETINNGLSYSAKGTSPFLSLNRLGKEGWELVSADPPIPGVGVRNYILKREILG